MVESTQRLMRHPNSKAQSTLMCRDVSYIRAYRSSFRSRTVHTTFGVRMQFDLGARSSEPFQRCYKIDLNRSFTYPQYSRYQQRLEELALPKLRYPTNSTPYERQDIYSSSTIRTIRGLSHGTLDAVFARVASSQQTLTINSVKESESS